MNFIQFLSRFDDELIEELIGSPALRLLRMLDPELTSRDRLLDLVIELHPPASLVRDRSHRNLLVDLLSLGEARNLALAVGADDSEHDPYSSLKQLRTQRGSAREQALFDFFSLPQPKVEPKEEMVSAEPCQARYGLFAHQRRAVKQLQEQLAHHPRRAVLHMPTGSGKTRTTMHLIVEHLKQHEPSVVVWLAHSEELCNQAAEEFQKAWGYLGNRDLEIYRFWGNSDLSIDQVEDGFLVAGLSKTYQKLKISTRFITELGRKCSFLILDEAHSAIAETYSLILDSLFVQRRSTSLLGLTATPGRTWSDIDVDEQLAQFFNRRKVTLEVEGYDNPVDYLVDEGYLARANFQSLFYTGGDYLGQNDIKKVEAAFDIPREILEKLAEDEQRNLLIVNRIEELARNHSRILVFAATVQHSDLLAAVLSVRGLRARSITSKTGSADRAREIEQYRTPSEDVQVLCNFGVLTTGFDAPQTSAALIARPTKSLVLYSQMVGRAIRGPKAGGNETAEIVTVIDQRLPGFGGVAEAFTNWEDIWE